MTIVQLTVMALSLALLPYVAGARPCLNLFARKDDPEIRCEEEQACKGEINVVFSRAESKAGKRLVGKQRSNAFPCYPLSDDDLWRSLKANPGNMDRVRDVARRARAKEPIKVVVLGGSVTNGGGCESYALPQSKKGMFGRCAWSHRFVNWMKEHFSNPHITLVPLCQPATTSVWILSHFDRVLESNPDLVLVDYAVNDPLYAEHDAAQRLYWKMMRASNERLVRRFLENKIPPKRGVASKGSPALMYVVLQRSWENSSYAFSREVYEPVCEHYGIPLVSVRDAVWPDVNVIRNPAVWETINGAHPIWKGHQLVTDVLAFVWTAAEATVASTTPGMIVQNSTFLIPNESRAYKHSLASPVRFPSVGVTALDACPAGKYLSPPIGSSERLVPSRVGNGWAWVDQNGKAGWQFDMSAKPAAEVKAVTRRLSTVGQPIRFNLNPQRRLRNARKKHANNDVLSAYVKSGQAVKVEPRLLPTANSSMSSASTVDEPVLPQPPRYTITEPLLGIISFPVRFDRNNPGLLVEYIKSYANFGQAVVWVTKNDETSTTAKFPSHGLLPPYIKSSAETMLSYAWNNKEFSEACKHESSMEKNGQHRRVNGSPDCSLIMAGSWTDPAILEGHWQDRSTQVSAGAKFGGLSVVQDNGMPHKNWHCILNKSAPFFIPENFQDGENIGAPRINNAGVDHGGDAIDTEVHFMMVPWSAKKDPDRRRFKIMGLESC
eukprot:CAMPEP_0171704342 /NCGR_PEP_ID=MMETSP0991-20121206/12617_1 /TAXON_ID=483369 /ORGANISM="non described non described, Strain CCMP2098" /LENGTH=719 /DNA_ID=CAMNT_0012293823 /DNA_START=1658 /DNA_END=3817 /DNA_ORIENTATION=-